MDLRHHSGKPASSQRRDLPVLEHLNLCHPLIVLAKLIDWNAIDQVAYEAMAPKHRRPPLQPRLVAGLLYLQHTFDLSDEEVVGLGRKSQLAGLYRRNLSANPAAH